MSDYPQPDLAFVECAPAIRARMLNQWAIEHAFDNFELARSYSKVADKICNDMAGRNMNGLALEKKGKTEKAIALYEQNVTDKFDGAGPYNRLRVLYTKAKRYSDAIRVCEAYLTMAEEFEKLGRTGFDVDKFQGWIDKLKAKVTGPEGPF